MQKYATNFSSAKIIKCDHERSQIIDYILSNIYKAYVLVNERHWPDAFIILYSTLQVIEIFNELILYIRISFVLALMLIEMEQREKAMEVMVYLRDVAEDTNNNKEAILVYEQLGKMYQDTKEHKVAIIAFKRML